MVIQVPASFSCWTVWYVHKNAIYQKPIPQIDLTNYQAMISRSCSTKIRYQTFSDPWVERIRKNNFPTSATGLNGLLHLVVHMFAFNKLRKLWLFSHGPYQGLRCTRVQWHGKLGLDPYPKMLVLGLVVIWRSVMLLS